MLGNMVIIKYYSRNIFEKGFVVNNNSAYGISIRDQNHTNLSSSIDSKKWF